MHLVMFDVDGTLVDSTGFDAALYAQSIGDHLGVEVDRSWGAYRHVTDGGILDELLGSHAAPERHAELRSRVREAFVARVRRHVQESGRSICEIAGAKRLFDVLAATPGVRVAIATGGWHETALLKLAAIGIDGESVALASSSDAVERAAIMRVAERRAMGHETSARRTYFGDGAWDQRASAEVGYDFIAVGRAVEHQPRLDDFSDLGAVLSLLGLPHA
jgi:phosphoglycolate phosphatase-like HAD superfamily hydrolase